MCDFFLCSDESIIELQKSNNLVLCVVFIKAEDDILWILLYKWAFEWTRYTNYFFDIRGNEITVGYEDHIDLNENRIHDNIFEDIDRTSRVLLGLWLCRCFGFVFDVSLDVQTMH